MKPNKKQIEANLRNKLASQYTQKINLLKERVSSLISINLEYRTEINTLKRENFELKDKVQQYENWIERLHEFMSMNESDLGDRESSNAFAKELVRIWNEFPKELKQ